MLPIWEIHAAIVDTLRAGNRLVLVAPTGSGKTTQVPQMLLDAGLAGEKKIVVLQPRRVAARTVAARVAWERNGRLGGEVGYQIRFEDHTSLGTRICFVTEGILLRWLQDDRELSDVSIVLFDLWGFCPLGHCQFAIDDFSSVASVFLFVFSRISAILRAA